MINAGKVKKLWDGRTAAYEKLPIYETPCGTCAHEHTR
jgi:hypothetical protein